MLSECLYLTRCILTYNIILNMKVLINIIVISSVLSVASALYCLSCKGIAEARNCADIEKCSDGQVCYSTQMISPKGIIFRNMGCRDVAMCKHGVIVGKRNIYNRESMVNVDKFDESLEAASNQAKMAEVRSI
ncbi:uncharacterized protein LOC132728416 [Ruditapes philippinarum]|uniref:uncharacterized protein LOC132728416 n=1 Tax=Ruditapes philippinarum TaxID=129788 RepID=UPI00295A9F4B|nr:uncharacterized protein LOC132728416 [Ruditapes philippinarum]